MINPSANGWIDKFFFEQQLADHSITDTEAFYRNLRETGFIFGHIIAFNTTVKIRSEEWLRDEISKVALLNGLYDIFCITEKNHSPKEFISKAVAFYNQMHPGGFSLLKKVLPTHSDSYNLEKIIDDRVQTNDNIISKNFSHIVTNALLFVDLLAFQKYLVLGAIPEKYLKRIEETIINIVTLALQTKTNKSQHDDLLVKLFEASVRYTKFSKLNIQNLEALHLEYYTSDLEKFYLLDIAGLAMWSDGKVEKDEAYFLYKLASYINVSDKFTEDSIVATNEFITQYKKEIPYFNYSNPVKHFYEQTTQLITTLIIRNKKRLIKEITQNRDLMILLAQSTTRDLEKSEKKKVKKQLLEICKTIPSLTIFLIPGGSLLLPILVKFIPQLIPTSFNENLGEE